MDDKTDWTKVTLAENSSSQQAPSAPIKELAKLIEKLGGNALSKGIAVNKEKDAYRVIIDYNQMENKDETIKEFKEQFIAGFKASAPAELASTLTPDKIQLDKNIFKIYIDEKTFQATKMEQEVIIGMNTDLFKLKTDILTTLDLKGEFKGTIEVPEDVKNSAKSISF